MSLDDRLCVIDEDMDINSFSVLEITDVAVTHTSTIGLEMAMLGKPSIILGSTHYKGKGFTIDPSTAPEYIEAIKAGLASMASKGPCVRTQNGSKKYFYMMMFLYQKTIPVSHFGAAFNSYGYPSFETLMKKDSTFQSILKELKSPHRSSFVEWK
jgi:capsule polysaccharide export protein KpsC/LpsZ